MGFLPIATRVVSCRYNNTERLVRSSWDDIETKKLFVSIEIRTTRLVYVFMNFQL